MNKKLLMPIAAAVLTVAAIMPAKGWNGVGHSVIAYIAEQHLTPEAKEKCRGYLHHTLPYYASWMDLWRNCPGFEATSKTHAVPVDETFRHIKNDEKNAVYHIIRIQKKMKKYNKMQDSLVRDNLKYLIHLVGDMHCPSHTRYEKSPEYKSYSFYIGGKKKQVAQFLGFVALDVPQRMALRGLLSQSRQGYSGADSRNLQGNTCRLGARKCSRDARNFRIAAARR